MPGATVQVDALGDGAEGAAMTTLDDVAKKQASSPAEQRASVELAAGRASSRACHSPCPMGGANR
jgi:hypothetical protein